MKFKIMMLAAGAVAGSMLLFQNCSQVKTAGVGGGSDLKGSTYHGDTLSGTSTDNPNTASLKVALDKFQPLQLDASLCIMGTATKQIAEPPEAMRAPASSSETKKDCDKDDDDRKSKYKKRKYSSAPRAASVGTLQSALAQQQAALQGLIDQILHDFDTPVEIASISSGGTDLGEQPVKMGDFNSYELRLNRACLGQSSLAVQNINGSFATSDELVLTFKGDLHVDSHTTGLVLDMSNYLPALEKVKSSSQIAVALRGVAGTLRTQVAP